MINQARVCIITTIHPPFDGRIYERAAKGLAYGGFSVTLIAPWPQPNEAFENLRLVSMPAAKSRSQRAASGFNFFLKAMRHDADVYYFHDLDFIVWATLLKLLKRKNVVYDCHENYPEEILYSKHWIPEHVRKPLSAVVRLVENTCVRILKNVVVVVPNLYTRFNAQGTNVELVRNFSSWTPSRSADHEGNIVCTGSVSQEYGSEVLLGIARELRARDLGIKLIIADRFGEAGLKDRFLRLIEEENLPLIIHERVHPKNIFTILKKARVAIAVEQDTPNMRIGYHAKLFEYMAFGMPIVASNIESNAMIVRESGAGLLVPPASPTHFVDESIRLLNDEKLYGELSDNALAAIRGKFNWNAERQKLITFFEGIVQTRAGKK